MQLLSAFGKVRQAFHDGEPSPLPTNQNILLRLTGTLGDRAQTFLIPFDGESGLMQVSTRAGALALSERDWNAYQVCNLRLDNIPPPFKGGQCEEAYDYSVTWWDSVDNLQRTANLSKRGPLVPLSFDSDGFLRQGTQIVAGGGENRIIAPRMINIRLDNGQRDNCGDIPAPHRYFCPENPKKILALAPNTIGNPYIANGWMLTIRISSDVPTPYRVDFRV
jgi:hypothetical protein